MPRTKYTPEQKPAYQRWKNMHGRCKYKKPYLDAGITVCERWSDFQNFFADMGNPTTPKHTLDRIDGTKGYSPDNCRWATYKEQNQNLRSNIRHNGVVLAELAREVGLSRSTVVYRLAKGQDVSAPRIDERTHCKAGHAWTDENTYMGVVKYKDGLRVQKYCRACRAAAQANFRKKYRESRETLKQTNPKRT